MKILGTWLFALVAILAADLAAAGCSQAAQPKLPQAMGCYTDQSNGQSDLGGRDLNGFKAPDSQSMTVATCTATCKAKGFTYAGMQNSSSCYCGNAYGRTGKSTQCKAICAGSPGEVCGGVWANSVYKVK